MARVTAFSQWPQVMPVTVKVWFMGTPSGKKGNCEPCHGGKVNIDITPMASPKLAP
jgi:inosine-uridine nucleoside N-ribohydrolase